MNTLLVVCRISCLLLGVSPLAVLAKPVTIVELGTVESMQGQPRLSLAGELTAIRSARVAAEVAGKVGEVLAESGDKVAFGDDLAVVGETPALLRLQAMEARVAEARAGAERAAINERRLARLLPRKAVSQDEYDEARVELARQKAILATRQAEAQQQADQLQRHHVRAPFSATVVSRYIELGQWLDVGDPCYDIDDTTVLRARVAVPQQYFGQILEGSEVRLRVDAMPQIAHDLKVSRKLPNIRSAGRSFEAWVDIDNSKMELVPGLSVRAEIALQGPPGENLLVSRDAVIKLPDGSTVVWLVREADGEVTVNSLPVQVSGARDEQLIVQAASLQSGMAVVTRGNEALSEGQAVRLVDSR